MKKITSILIVSLLLSVGLFGAGRMQEQENCINNQYYQFMVFRMSEELQLTDQQAEKLFPILRPYREAKMQSHEKMAAISDEVYKRNTISAAELEQFKNEVKNLHLDEVKKDDEFYTKIETFLNPDQVAKFIFFEQRFRRELSQELKDRYNIHKDPPRKNKSFWPKHKK